MSRAKGVLRFKAEKVTKLIRVLNNPNSLLKLHARLSWRFVCVGYGHSVSNCCPVTKALIKQGSLRTLIHSNIFYCPQRATTLGLSTLTE